MKKELFFICTAAMLGTVCFTNLTADKASAKTSGDYQYVVTGKKKKTCAIRKYLGSDTDVVVPKKIDGYMVTRIGNQAFKGNKKIQSIKLPKGITIIGRGAFLGCSKLKSIELPQKIHTIQTRAFCSCKSLKNLTLPSNLKEIGEYVFSGCPLKEINIPQNLEEIDSYTFPSTLDSITVDEKNKKYDSRDNCNAIIETSSNTLILGSNNTTIPDSITAIGSNAFDSYNGLKEITIPGSVETIEQCAFLDCDHLEKVNMSEGLITIGYRAFEGCDSLRTVKLPDSVEEIEEFAFFCNSLENIHIPKNMKKTDDMPYIFCSTSLKKITVDEGNPYYDSRDNCNAVIETASDTLVLAFDKTVIPNTIKTIGKSAFLSTPSELVIPEGVEKLADCAFCDETEDEGPRMGECPPYTLEKITLPSTVNYIGSSAFSQLHSLREINIPDGVTAIKNDTFQECDNLEKISLPSSLTTIEQSAFYLCTSLSTITIPDSVQKIEDYAFCGCEKLNKITLPLSLKSLGYNSFDESLKTINYRGSKAQWKKIKIDTGSKEFPNNWLTGVKINYNYKG